MPSSIQLWSVREAIERDGWTGAVDSVAAAGFTQVEPFAIDLTLGDVQPPIRRLGLGTPTAHGFLDADKVETTLDAAERLGVAVVFHPHLPEPAWEDAAALERTAELLTTAADAAAARGIRVGFHNHDYELLRQVEGRSAFWALLDRLPTNVLVEFDVYWAAIAEIDIVDAVTRLGDRAAALHIKDGPVGRTAADQVALGDGDLPLDQILEAAPTAHRVLSLDRMPGDAERIRVAVERSAAWLDARGLL